MVEDEWVLSDDENPADDGCNSTSSTLLQVRIPFTVKPYERRPLSHTHTLSLFLSAAFARIFNDQWRRTRLRWSQEGGPPFWTNFSQRHCKRWENAVVYLLCERPVAVGLTWIRYILSCEWSSTVCFCDWRVFIHTTTQWLKGKLMFSSLFDLSRD